MKRLAYGFLVLGFILLPACEPEDATTVDGTIRTEARVDAVDPFASAGVSPEAASAREDLLGEEDVLAFFRDRLDVALDDLAFGDLHAHTRYSIDALRNCDALGPGDALEFAASEEGAGLDFVALVDHAEQAATAEAEPEDHYDVWKSLERITRNFEAEREATGGRAFVVFPGWEYTATNTMPATLGCYASSGYGHKQVLFQSMEDMPSARFGACQVHSWLRAGSAFALWKKLDHWRPGCPDCVGPALTVPHHSARREGTDWRYLDPDFVRHVEIYSSHGSSEGYAPATCADPDPPWHEVEHQPNRVNAVRAVLHREWMRKGNPDFQLAFLGGTDNHSGRPGAPWIPPCTEESLPFRGGLTGIVSPRVERNLLWRALWNRQTVATSGPRIPLLLAVSTPSRTLLMGERGGHEGLIRLRALAADSVERFEVVLDGCLIATETGERRHAHRSLDLTLPLGAGRHYIYLRAITGDDHRAWTSPVYLE